MQLSTEDTAKLLKAIKILEYPSFTAKTTKTVGNIFEKTLNILPWNLSRSITDISHIALQKSLESALFTLSSNKKIKSSHKTHQALVGFSGAVGGVFGMAALTVELPVSTTIMLRSIAQIARENGENLNHPETKLACLEVFALGDNPTNNNTETGYYAIRSLLAKSLSEAATHLSSQSLAAKNSPALIKLLNAIATRFSIPVSEKFAAQSVPAVGAIGGATVNLLFIRYFQNIAQAHFSIRSLERKYSEAFIREQYKNNLIK